MVKRPSNFDSERQRRWYFATHRFSRRSEARKRTKLLRAKSAERRASAPDRLRKYLKGLGF